jgi:hypothetical protein
MSMRFIFLAALASAAGHATAKAAITEDFRCLSSTSGKPVHLEFRMFSDPNSNWSGGYVKYQGAKKVMLIAPGKTLVLDRPEGRPWEFETTWLELAEGKVTGEYVVVSQGANIEGFRYTSKATGKSFEFEQDIAASGDSACEWNRGEQLK